jgi:hypothetical protein
MATSEDVNRIASSLPEVAESATRDGLRQWRVKDKLMVWERPLRHADYEALGEDAPQGPILGVRVPDLVAKEALLAEEGEVIFATPHFDGYPAVLVQLDQITITELKELIVDAWVTQAPKRLVGEWEESRDKQVGP